MTSDVNTSRRPSLEPLWTNYRSHRAVSKTAYLPAPLNTGLSPSPLSPRSLPSPSPVHPASYDGSMQRQDRALVNSLDQRAKHVISTAPLTPINENSPSPLVARLEKISILPPMSTIHTPASPNLSPRRDSYHALERSRLASLPGTPIRSPSYYSTGGLSPVSSRKNSAGDFREQLRTWGHVYYGNAKTADAFIIARSLRRPNSRSSTDTTGRDYRQGPPTTPASPQARNRLTVRAIVRPRALERPSFLIQRNFDMDQLRATIPDPSPRSATSQRSSIGSLHERSPTSPHLSPHSAALPVHSRARRASSVRSNTLIRSGANNLDLDTLMRDAKAVPIRE